jgi:sn1-specific diacylglycerol lipase
MQVIYYIAVDRQEKKVVLAIRGTMSLQDCITDAYAVATPMASEGRPNSYTHAGFLFTARALVDDLAQRQVLLMCLMCLIYLIHLMCLIYLIYLTCIMCLM